MSIWKQELRQYRLKLKRELGLKSFVENGHIIPVYKLALQAWKKRIFGKFAG